MHPPSTDEQQSGWKWFQAYAQPGDDSGNTVGPRSEGFHNQPPKPVKNKVNQPGCSSGRRLAHHIHDIRRQALHIGGYAVRHTYSEREKLWNLFQPSTVPGAFFNNDPPYC